MQILKADLADLNVTFFFRYFRHNLEIFCEWIPQMLFLVTVIGYLCILILVKWSSWTVADANVII